MSNLFYANLTQDQINTRDLLRSNVNFCSQLIRDVKTAFDVVSEEKRTSESQFKTTIYSPRQAGRYGFGFCFEATDKGVSFQDERGLWLRTIAKCLNVKVSDQYSQKDADRDILKNAVKSLDASMGFSKCIGAGDHYHLNMTLFPNDPKRDDKIKLIISIIMEHGITTKI